MQKHFIKVTWVLSFSNLRNKRLVTRRYEIIIYLFIFKKQRLKEFYQVLSFLNQDKSSKN